MPAAMGSLDECRRQINRELRYQSSMDLDEETYAIIRRDPPRIFAVIIQGIEYMEWGTYHVPHTGEPNISALHPRCRLRH